MRQQRKQHSAGTEHEQDEQVNVAARGNQLEEVDDFVQVRNRQPGRFRAAQAFQQHGDNQYTDHQQADNESAQAAVRCISPGSRQNEQAAESDYLREENQ